MCVGFPANANAARMEPSSLPEGGGSPDLGIPKLTNWHTHLAL
jgi:hypothetical protein